MLGWELPPHNSGGLGVACLNLTQKLANSGADIEFVIPFEADYNFNHMRISSCYASNVNNVKISAYGSLDSNKLIDGEREYTKTVLKIVDEREFDIIHAHDWLTFRSAMRVKEKTGLPLIVHIHSIESDRAGGMGNKLVREIEQLTLMIADKVITVSERTKQSIIREYGISSDAIEVVHNSIDFNDLEPLGESNIYYYLNFLKQNGYKIVCNVGRQTLQKGLSNLIQAAQKVIKLEPKTIFLFVGDGDQQFELIELAAQLEISRNFIFTGFQRGKKAIDAFAIADLFVMPSVSEPFGLTPLEAICYGSPTLISKQSGVAEVLKHTLKVDYWDVNEMANQIVGAIRSDDFLKVLHANAFNQVNDLSWQLSADKVISLYESFSKSVV